MSSTTAPPNIGLTLPERVGPSIQRFKRIVATAGQNLRVCMPGVIQSFDAAKQTCTVRPAITDQVRVQGQLTIVQIPDLEMVPVMFPRSGKFSVTFPVTAGDECLIVFADQCTDAWLQNGLPAGGVGDKATPVNQMELRRHDLSDSFVIVGLQNSTRALADYSTDSIQIRTEDGQTIVDVANGVITLTAATVNVNTSGNCSVQADGDCTVNAASATIAATDSVIIAGSSSVSIGDNVTIDSRVFLQHKHSGVATGMGVSGPVI